MPYIFKPQHTKMLAKWIRNTEIPEKYKKQLCYDLLPQMLMDNTAFNYEQFFTMTTGEKYRGVNYGEI